MFLVLMNLSSGGGSGTSGSGGRYSQVSDAISYIL